MNDIAIVAGAVAILILVGSGGAGAVSGGVLSVGAVKSLAESTVARWFPNIDPRMLRAMVEIESGRNPTAWRVEPQISDASIGLMQTLLGTAQWLATDIGYTAFGVPSSADLLKPEVSIYFGAAYVDYLSKYRGQAQSEEWIVRAYNGGPTNGPTSSATVRHWQKYQAAKAAL